MAKQSAWITAGVIGVLLYLVSKKDTVNTIVVSSGLAPDQPFTGIAQYDSRNPATMPNPNFPGPQNPVLPIGDIREGATARPANPQAATCPTGYRLWYDIATGSYSCWPVAPGDAQFGGNA